MNRESYSLEEIMALKHNSQLTDIKSYIDTPVASYTYNGNAEIVASAVEIATGTFTCAAHGLANGNKVFPTLNLDSLLGYPIASYPVGLTQALLFVVNKTDDTFQVSATSGGAAITFSGAGDLTKWHFEKHNVESIEISGLPAAKQYKVNATGKTATKTTLYFGPTDIVQNDWIVGTSFGYPSLFDLTGSVYFSIEAIMRVSPIGIIKYAGSAVNASTNSANARSEVNTAIYKLSESLADLTTAKIYVVNGSIANGTTMEVYKV